ncbi:hypothetical protein ON010_g4946 [Phytophthora cinnamomi]|nr:hypothetical protein ON010_g4946 [Phytophthora cinnamomi]
MCFFAVTVAMLFASADVVAATIDSKAIANGQKNILPNRGLRSGTTSTNNAKERGGTIESLTGLIRSATTSNVDD